MKKIAVIGLGYVGLPLARLFATKYPVVGFDINQKRIAGLRSGTDSTMELSDEILQSVLVEDLKDKKETVNFCSSNIRSVSARLLIAIELSKNIYIWRVT